MTSTKRLAECALFISLALVLSYIERFFPLQAFIPLPGVKLGLANVVTMVSLMCLGKRDTFIIVILRCILGSMFGGGVTGLMFSLTGGMLSVSVMIAVSKVPYFSIYGVSILGAAAHNIGQILAAVILMQSIYILTYLPWLLLTGLVTGLVIAILSSGVLRILRNLPEFM